MQVNVTVDMNKALKLLNQLNGKEIQDAARLALKDAGFEARKIIQSSMDTSFDRVTPYVKKSIIVKPSQSGDLSVTVEPTYQGGKGVDPKNILMASVFGGPRKQKKSERILQRVGILPNGYSIVPGEACPLDAYGNVKGSFLVQLISYFQAFGEQGYRANATQKRIAKIADKGVSAGGYKTINGVVYFIAYGRLRGGKTGHLHPGIWSRSGIHGSNVQPILMFVRKPTYQVRLDFFDKPVKAALAKFDTRFRYQMRLIIEAKA